MTSSWSARSRIRSVTTLVGAKVFRPNIGGLLPVFVLDRYEGLEAKLLQDFTRAERERYVALNATALCAQMPADLVFANHVLLGAAVGWASGMPFAVKAHGSELEYSMRGNDDLAAWGRECLAAAEAVFVGSAHIRNVLEEVVGHVERVYEVPPGVDVEEFRPSASREESLARLLEEARADRSQPGERRRAAAGPRQRGAARRILCRRTSPPSSTSASSSTTRASTCCWRLCEPSTHAP